MALLIRGGYIMTMTEQGSFTGDVLIADGRIRAVGPHITDTDGMEPTELNAQGLTILPGMIDAGIRSAGFDAAYLAETAVASGVTSALLLPDEGPQCQLLTAAGAERIPLRCHAPAGQHGLLSAMQKAAAAGNRLICAVHDAEECAVVLDAAAETGADPILTGLQGCQGLAQRIAEAHCGAVISVAQARRGSQWVFAAELDEAGVHVAISTGHPAAKMKLLPVCASLCVRDGMARDRALACITSAPADLLGLNNRGRIAKGCRADLAIFDGDPLLLATSLIMTIAGGHIYRRA